MDKNKNHSVVIPNTGTLLLHITLTNTKEYYSYMLSSIASSNYCVINIHVTHKTNDNNNMNIVEVAYQ